MLNSWINKVLTTSPCENISSDDFKASEKLIKVYTLILNMFWASLLFIYLFIYLSLYIYILGLKEIYTSIHTNLIFTHFKRKIMYSAIQKSWAALHFFKFGRKNRKLVQQLFKNVVNVNTIYETKKTVTKRRYNLKLVPC